MLQEVFRKLMQRMIDNALSAIPPSVISAWGISSKTGFQIGVRPIFPRELRSKELYFRTAKFTDEQEIAKTKWWTPSWRKLADSVISITLVGLLSLFLNNQYLIFTDPSFTKGVGAILAVLGAWATLCLLIWITVGIIHDVALYRTTTSQWHGAEHKSIKLIEEGLPPSVELLRSIPRISHHCGSAKINIVFDYMYSVLFLMLGLWILSEQPLWTILLFAAAVILVSAAKRTFRAPALWFQKFNTREPTNQQLQEAIELIDRVYQTVGYVPEISKSSAS